MIRTVKVGQNPSSPNTWTPPQYHLCFWPWNLPKPLSFLPAHSLHQTSKRVPAASFCSVLLQALGESTFSEISFCKGALMLAHGHTLTHSHSRTHTHPAESTSHAENTEPISIFPDYSQTFCISIAQQTGLLSLFPVLMDEISVTPRHRPN